jgi:hypothetical protein
VVALTSAPPHSRAATIKRRIERHDERIEAFFDSIGQEPTLTLFRVSDPM